MMKTLIATLAAVGTMASFQAQAQFAPETGGDPLDYNNTIYLEQVGEGHSIYIEQTGENNHIGALQQGNAPEGTDNEVSLFQDGAYNTLLFEQDGGVARIITEQGGEENVMELRISGEGTDVTATQLSNGNYMLYEDGPNAFLNTAVLTQEGPLGDHMHVVQTGAENFAEVIQR